MSKCEICKAGFSPTDIIVVCCVCNDLFHAAESNEKNCDSTTATEYRVLKLKSKPLMVYRSRLVLRGSN